MSHGQERSRSLSSRAVRAETWPAAPWPLGWRCSCCSDQSRQCGVHDAVCVSLGRSRVWRMSVFLCGAKTLNRGARSPSRSPPRGWRGDFH
eukprot:6709006-Prymnesium_polylepis.1